MADDELSLKILGVTPDYDIAGARRLLINTSRGDIPLILHSVEGNQKAVLAISGALGGLDGPMRVYARLGLEMPSQGISVARLDYRMPNEFADCLMDTLAGLAFLKGIGVQHVALLGHSFGAAVAINAGTLNPLVATVIAISSQLAGAHVVADLAPRPLLLVHGTADTILPDECSKRLYERAGEPKELKLLDGADHIFSKFGGELFVLLSDWLLENL